MGRLAIISIFILFVCNTGLRAQGQAVATSTADTYVQISGVVLEEDSLKPAPFVSILVKGTKHGTVTDYYGFFTIVAKPGDQLQFFSVTHRNAIYDIPDTLKEKHYSMIKILTRDTQQLAPVTVFPWPTKEQFRKAILDLDLSGTDLDRAAKNMDNEDMRIAMNGMTMDAQANYRVHMQQQYTKLYTAGQYPSISLLNPIAWAQFIDAWRKGKFKSQTPKK